MRAKIMPSSANAIEVRCVVAADLLVDRIAERHRRLVVPHVLDDVRRLTVLGAQLGELGVELAVFDRPDLSVLRLEDVVLGIVDDALLSVRRRRAARREDCEKKGRAKNTDHELSRGVNRLH